MASYLLPEGLDLAELLPDEKPLFRDYCGAVVSIIAERTGGKISRKTQRSPFVRLNSRKLRKIIPDRQLFPALKQLKRLGIVASDGKYSTGRYSKGYRLLSPWNRRPLRVAEVNGRPARQIEKARAEQLRPSLPVHFHLIDHQKRLTIDRFAAERHAVEIAAHTKKDCLPFYNAAIGLLAGGIWLFKPDRSGRVHTNYTICPRKLRQFIRYDGQELVKIDISAAQAFILPQIFKRGEISLKTLQNSNSNKSLTLTPMCRISLEVEELLDLVCSDTFYRVWRYEGGFTTRKAAKKGFVGFLNNTTKEEHFRKEAALFSALFPGLGQFVASFWGQTTPWGKSLLSYLLQREEAEWMIEGVCGRLLAANPEIPLIPVHDCIATTAEHAAIVEKTIKDVAIERYGIAPHLKMD